MPINEKFLAARSAERRQRAITYLPHPPAVILPLRVRFSLFRCIVARSYWAGYVFAQRAITLCHYTERQRIELCFADSAFLTGRVPLSGDIFLLLWRLHPDFIRPDHELPNRRHPGQAPRYATPKEQLRSAHARQVIIELVRDLDTAAAIPILKEWLALSDQDAPSAEANHAKSTRRKARVSALPESCPWDDLCDYYGREYRMTRDEVLDSPRAWLHQLYRNTLLNQPDAELNVIAPSDALLASISQSENRGQAPGLQQQTTGQASVSQSENRGQVPGPQQRATV